MRMEGVSRSVELLTGALKLFCWRALALADAAIGQVCSAARRIHWTGPAYEKALSAPLPLISPPRMATLNVPCSTESWARIYLLLLANTGAAGKLLLQLYPIGSPEELSNWPGLPGQATMLRGLKGRSTKLLGCGADVARCLLASACLARSSLSRPCHNDCPLTSHSRPATLSMLRVSSPPSSGCWQCPAEGRH